MKIVPIADVKAKLSKYIEKIESGPVIVTKNGRPSALLLAVPKDEDELEKFILAYNPKFRSIIDAAYRRIQTKGGMKHKDFWKAGRNK